MLEVMAKREDKYSFLMAVNKSKELENKWLQKQVSLLEAGLTPNDDEFKLAQAEYHKK